MTLRHLISQTLPLSGETIEISSYRVLQYCYRKKRVITLAFKEEFLRRSTIFTLRPYAVS